MKTETIRRIAIESGLADKDLSSNEHGQLMTDYGPIDGIVEVFAAMLINEYEKEMAALEFAMSEAP